MKKVSASKISLHDFLVESLQNYWYISFVPKKYVKPNRNYDISAGNIREITDKYVSVKYYRFYVIPSFIKINFVDIDVIKRFIKRKNRLTNVDVLSLNRKSKLSKKQAKLAALFKWGFFLGVIVVVGIICAGVAVGVSFLKK